jgi:hypothetical protein
MILRREEVPLISSGNTGTQNGFFAGRGTTLGADGSVVMEARSVKQIRLAV